MVKNTIYVKGNKVFLKMLLGLNFLKKMVFLLNKEVST